MTVPDYDVLVIGAGIHGAGVGQAAAAAGYTVAVLEQTAVAAGTSSRSSKLIHGGLRYLETAQFALVHEALRERELLIHLAPDLVRRQHFIIPVYGDSSRSRWWIGAGLSLYSLLCGLKAQSRFRVVPRSEWVNLDGLGTAGLRTVFRYTDAQTDDAALTGAVMRSASEMGAALICPARVRGGRHVDGAVEIEYETGGGPPERVTGRAVVNATGAWSSRLAGCFDPPLPMVAVENVQGSHLELPGRTERGCYYLEVPEDGRAVFVIPWKGERTLLGTTENPYRGDPAKVAVLDEEKEYLLGAYRRYFPRRSYQVLDAWAGLRVLPADRGRAFGRSRETLLPVDRRDGPRAISILGGKLTTYRATAEKVIDILGPGLPKRTRRADTRTLKLSKE